MSAVVLGLVLSMLFAAATVNWPATPERAKEGK